MENKKLFLKFIVLPILIIEIAKFSIPAISIFETSTPFDIATVLLFLYVSALFVKTLIAKNSSSVALWGIASLTTWSIIDFVFGGIRYSLFGSSPTFAGYFSVIISVLILYTIYTTVAFLIGGVIGNMLKKNNVQ